MNKEKDQKSIFKKIITIITVIVMLFAMVAFLSLIIQVAGGKKPSLFGYRFYYILTESMTPQLEVNDVILSETINSSQEAKNRIKKGDVVTFIAEYGIQKGLTITHKVVKEPYFDEEKGREGIITKGVKEGATEDPLVPLENIQAVMVRKMSALGAFYRFVMSTTGLLIIIILPMVIMLCTLIARLVFNIKNPSQKKLSPQEEVARKAVEDYKKKRLEEEIAKKAVEEYKKLHNIKD